MAQQSHPAADSTSRIVVADDDPLIRHALTTTIDEQPDLEVVAEATDGLEALELCRRFQPELVLTAAQDPIYLSEALKAGAAGYVQKGATTEETIGAVRKVLEGESSLDQELATQLLKRLMEDPQPEPSGRVNKESLTGLLSTRESEVLGLVARGYANQQIARKLLISVSTVKKHVRNVICTLGVSDRTQAAVRAVELGVLDRCKV